MKRSENKDALQARLYHFLKDTPTARSVSEVEECCIGSSTGAVRKQNQDRGVFAFANYGDKSDRDFVLAVVCDGIGGLAKGDLAASLAISVFATRVLRTARLPIAEKLRSAAEDANAAVYNEFSGKGGTTLSAVFLSEKYGAFGLNVGDSRIYGRENSGKPTQLSKDDTLAGYLGDHGSDHRNDLVQFIGMGEGIEPNFIPINRVKYSSLLISSDGIHGAPPDAFSQVCKNAATSGPLVRRLLSLSEMLGGKDNATALVLPANTRAFVSPTDQGLNLSFVSAWNRLEIWFPIISEESQARRSSSDPINSTPTGNDTPEKKPQSATKSRKTKKKVVREDLKLPLDEERPHVEVAFPKKI